VRVVVDRDLCCTYAQCVATAPDVFRIEDEQLVYDPTPDEELRSVVEEAVQGCPAQAIRLED
jgi:ferredoxin